MSTKVIKLKTTRSTKSGVYGKYVPISNTRGVKILKAKFSSLKRLYRSEKYYRATEEVNMLKVLNARNCDFVPKCYGLRIIQVGKNYHIGILLQHLGNVQLNDLRLENGRDERIWNRIEKQIEKFGFSHSDIHTSNIMFYKNKYWLIDFSPEFINHH
jgi:tRNA A-37 threonylcarbamoyl transferase component Bud32